MGEKFCIVNGILLTADIDSEAHIVASALGGRLKPKGLISTMANGDLNQKFDLPLFEAYRPLGTLLGISRDRGKNQPVVMTDDTGSQYDVAFGEYLRPKRPEFEKSETPEGVHYQIRSRDMREARTLLGRVKKDYPDLDIEAALQKGVIQEAFPEGMLKTQIVAGPRVTFPAAFVMASLFSAHHGLQPHPELRSYVTSFDPAKQSCRPTPSIGSHRAHGSALTRTSAMC